jgi:hypothetical protein
MSYTYSSYKTALAELMVVPESDANFVSILPSIIEYAEMRCYRELDLISTVVRDSSASLTVDTRTFNLPSSQGRFVVVEGVNLIEPAGASVATGSRRPLVPVSREVLDYVWPSEVAPDDGAPPSYFAMVTDQILLIAPAPGSVYNVEVVGTIRPTALSEANDNTFLTNFLPDLFMAASMVFASGYQKNFGSQADDPKMALSWEGQYKALFASANLEEMRKKFTSVSWSSKNPAPAAVPQRG